MTSSRTSCFSRPVAGLLVLGLGLPFPAGCGGAVGAALKKQGDPLPPLPPEVVVEEEPPTTPDQRRTPDSGRLVSRLPLDAVTALESGITGDPGNAVRAALANAAISVPSVRPTNISLSGTGTHDSAAAPAEPGGTPPVTPGEIPLTRSDGSIGEVNGGTGSFVIGPISFPAKQSFDANGVQRGSDIVSTLDSSAAVGNQDYSSFRDQYGARAYFINNDGIYGIIVSDWMSTDQNGWVMTGTLVYPDSPDSPVLCTAASTEASCYDAAALAFVDGPELEGTGSGEVTFSGTAKYIGHASGLYAYGVSPSAPDSYTGIFTAPVELLAEFGRGRISGCAGCGVGVQLAGLPSEGNPVNSSYPLNIVFSPVPIGGAGPFSTFRSTGTEGVTVTLSGGAALAASSGSLGGRFSDTPAGSGRPRLAAGTLAVEWAETGRGQGSLLGTWTAGTD